MDKKLLIGKISNSWILGFQHFALFLQCLSWGFGCTRQKTGIIKKLLQNCNGILKGLRYISVISGISSMSQESFRHCEFFLTCFVDFERGEDNPNLNFLPILSIPILKSLNICEMYIILVSCNFHHFIS